MIKKLVVTGGGENGRILENGEITPYETEPMDREIIKLTEKEKPNFLFMAHSQESIEIQESYFQTMKQIFEKKFGCSCRDLKSIELKNIEKVKEKIAWADIIYEGGGDTEIMIKLWKDNGFDKILYDAWNNGKVMCGISAGAVCWFKSCDSESVTLKEKQNISQLRVDCLGWVNAHFTPHCEETGRYEITKENLKQSRLVGIMLSDCAALEIIDDQYRMIISYSNRYKFERAYGLKTYWNDNEYKEEKITISNEFKNINNLLNK